RVHLADAGLAHGPAPEAVRPYRDHRVLHAYVPVDRDVLHVHDGGAVDHYVVDDPRTAPAAPPGAADEPRAAPPRHARIAPAQRHPAHERSPHGHAHPGRAEEGDQRRRVHRAHYDRAGV